MKKNVIILILLGVIIIFTALGYMLLRDEIPAMLQQGNAVADVPTSKLVDFSQINSEFLFSAEVPESFEVEYIPQLRAISVYDPSSPGSTTIDKSQLYISFFRANAFLTLSTVDITRRDAMVIGGHDAILYEITKKSNVQNFSGQPDWRNSKHLALDIRVSQDNPTYFYSFAYNPKLKQKVFDDFIDSITFKLGN